MENLTVRTPKGSGVFKSSTLDRLTPRELLSCVDVKAGDRSEQPFWEAVDSNTLYDLTSGALVPNDSSDAKLRVSVLYGHASIWSVQWAAWKLEEDVRCWDDEGVVHRPITFRDVDGGNHFVSVTLLSLHKLNLSL